MSGSSEARRITETRIVQIGTHIKVRDFDQSMAFYTGLGFPLLRRFGPGTEMPEKYRGAVFQVGSAYLEIAEGHKPIKPEVFLERIQSSKVSLLVNVESLQPLIAACRRHDIPILVPPRRFPWGQIELVVRDPDGLILSFSAPDEPDELLALEGLFEVPVERQEPDYTEAQLAALQNRSGPVAADQE
jgi:catechol 2,3-dioxygenase-like lactoylglutathione lyase family enzyme